MISLSYVRTCMYISAGIIFSTSQLIENDGELSPSLRSTKLLSRSDDILGSVAINSNSTNGDVVKPASGYQMGVGVCDRGEEEEEEEKRGGVGEAGPSSHDLLKVRQKKKVW